ncbi:MAG: hypothetical protein AAGM46_10235 [Cyanobacteria bacterium J06582_2]
MKYYRRTGNLWFGLSLLVTLYYGVWFYYFVFSQEYIVQDDVRQHVVWLQRFIDPELFTDDIIAEYFSGLATWGFKTLYFLAAKLGVEPILLAKILPPVLAFIATIYLYLFTLEIFPVPMAGFISSLLGNQLMWLNDDLTSATARAFLCPLFAAFLYYLARGSIIPCLILMLLQGWFYPHVLLIEVAILSLGLLTFKGKLPLNFSSQKQPYIWWIAGLIIAAIALYPITQKPPELATSVTAEQMRQMPEFDLGGRTPFFGVGWLNFWFSGSSGLSLPLFPTIVWSGLALPWLFKSNSPLVKLITSKIAIIYQTILASLLMFTLAHLMLPTLHLPSRFTYHTLRFILAITAAIALTIAIDLLINWIARKRQLKQPFNLFDKIKLSLITLAGITVVVFPAIPPVFTWFQGWYPGLNPTVYQHLAQQPKDTLVASLSTEADNIPAYSQRSILIAGEFAYAYHLFYHDQIKQRAIALLKAQYSPELSVLQSFIQQYGVDYILVDHDAFDPDYFTEKDWLIHSSWTAETERAIAQIISNDIPALKQLIPACSVVSNQNLDLVESSCILESSRLVQKANKSQ